MDKDKINKIATRAAGKVGKYVGTPLAKANAYLDEKAEGKIPENLRKALFGADSKKLAKDSEEVSEKMSNYKKGGKVKSYAKGGGCELKGKTKGRFV